MNSASYRHVAALLHRHTPASPHAESRLRGALDHVLGQPGKLLRARLVLFAGARHGFRPDAAERLACAVEFFHAASLVLDDLPCMDDADTRRSQPCVHKLHGDATAILAALALINRAYTLAGEAFVDRSVTVRRAATACLDRCLGVAGLVGGQAFDLAFAASDRSARMVSRIAAAKTGALFELAVLLPALAARPSRRERRALRALCVYLGQTYQIADDLRDVLSPSAEAGKTTGRDRALTRPNLALALGVPAARARLARLDRQARRALADLAAAGGARWAYLGAFKDGLLEQFSASPPAVRAA